MSPSCIQGTRAQDGTWLIECTQHGPLLVMAPLEPPDEEADKNRAMEAGKAHLRTAHKEDTK